MWLTSRQLHSRWLWVADSATCTIYLVKRQLSFVFLADCFMHMRSTECPTTAVTLLWMGGKTPTPIPPCSSADPQSVVIIFSLIVKKIRLPSIAVAQRTMIATNQVGVRGSTHQHTCSVMEDWRELAGRTELHSLVVVVCHYFQHLTILSLLFIAAAIRHVYNIMV